MRVRDFSKLYEANDGSRTLLESIVAPEVAMALEDWKKSGAGGVLIGGLALSLYVRPRYTQDVDILYTSEVDIPSEVRGFKRNRDHSFQNNRTHVEVEVLTAEHTGLPTDVVHAIIATAVSDNGIMVATAAGLVASKLFRLSFQDKADIVSLIKAVGIDRQNLEPFGLDEDRLRVFDELHLAAESDPHP